MMQQNSVLAAATTEQERLVYYAYVNEIREDLLIFLTSALRQINNEDREWVDVTEVFPYQLRQKMIAIQNNPRLSSVDKDDIIASAICEAISTANLEALNCLVDVATTRQINFLQLQTPLMMAIQRLSLEMVQIIARSSEVDLVGNYSIWFNHDEVHFPHGRFVTRTFCPLELVQEKLKIAKYKLLRASAEMIDSIISFSLGRINAADYLNKINAARKEIVLLEKIQSLLKHEIAKRNILTFFRSRQTAAVTPSFGSSSSSSSAVLTPRFFSSTTNSPVPFPSSTPTTSTQPLRLSSPGTVIFHHSPARESRETLLAAETPNSSSGTGTVILHSAN
jgi:hypothetical protein